MTHVVEAVYLHTGFVYMLIYKRVQVFTRVHGHIPVLKPAAT